MKQTQDLDIEEQSPAAAGLYQVHIDNFDGPLELLWELIKKSKIDITEVSISSITEQYIKFIKHMENLNVKIASEFIWMASELLYYKSKALLPTEGIDDEYFTPPLPPELIQKLLEYKKYQGASRQLTKMFDSQSNSFQRTNTVQIERPDDQIEVSLFDLLKAFANVLDSQTVLEQEEIIFDEILVSDRIEYITELLKEKEVIIFREIFNKRPVTAEVIASFVAVLEMAKMQIVRVLQYNAFGEIRITRHFSLQQLS